MEVRPDVVKAVKAEAEGLGLAAKTGKKTTKKCNPLEKKILLWVPLEFPEVPKKGDFDVSRLRDSTYFFS
jgi:DNA-directed RNA polymerase